MPKRKRTYAPSAKRAKVSAVRVPRIVRGGMPSKLQTTLVYGERVATSALIGEYVFSGNGLFDPNITGTGHQPRGFDEMMSLFDHYQVNSVKVYVNCINTGGDNSEFGMVYVLASDTTTSATNIHDILEHQSMTMKPYNYQDHTVNVLVKEFATKDQLSTKDYYLMRGSASANPVEQYFIHIGAFGTGGTSNDQVYYVRLEYNVTFSEPKTPGES